MRRSHAYLPTSRAERDQEGEAIRLALRAGLVEQFGSGLYGFAPAGERIRRKIIGHVEREMDAIGGQRVSLPQLQYRPRWEQSGRWESFEGEMFTLQNRDGQDMCLAPSHEEGIVHLVDRHVRSYEDLPVFFYQIGSKHRDDHARNGLLRTKEFTMKDAYSLHAERESLDLWYERVREAYCQLFERIGVEFVIAEAENSVMGGSASEEFVAPVETGTCGLVHCETDECRFGVTDEHPDFESFTHAACPDCGGTLHAGDGIEVGHVFTLGTRYADAMDLTIDLADGTVGQVEMGSYGIGITRVLQTLIEQHADEDGCRWPGSDAKSVAPWRFSIVPLHYEGDVRAAADRLHEASNDVLLFDDESQSIGERFAESDLLGIPTKVILGNHFSESGEVELESRDGETRYVDLETAVEVIRGEFP